MCFDEDDFNLGEFMIDKFWEIKSGRQANIVGVYFSEGFDCCYTLTGLDSRSDDVLFSVGRLLWVGLLVGDGNE